MKDRPTRERTAQNWTSLLSAAARTEEEVPIDDTDAPERKRRKVSNPETLLDSTPIRRNPARKVFSAPPTVQLHARNEELGQETEIATGGRSHYSNSERTQHLSSAPARLPTIIGSPRVPLISSPTRLLMKAFTNSSSSPAQPARESYESLGSGIGLGIPVYQNSSIFPGASSNSNPQPNFYPPPNAPVQQSSTYHNYPESLAEAHQPRERERIENSGENREMNRDRKPMLPHSDLQPVHYPLPPSNYRNRPIYEPYSPAPPSSHYPISNSNYPDRRISQEYYQPTQPAIYRVQHHRYSRSEEEFSTYTNQNHLPIPSQPGYDYLPTPKQNSYNFPVQQNQSNNPTPVLISKIDLITNFTEFLNSPNLELSPYWLNSFTELISSKPSSNPNPNLLPIKLENNHHSFISPHPLPPVKPINPLPKRGPLPKSKVGNLSFIYETGEEKNPAKKLERARKAASRNSSMNSEKSSGSGKGGGGGESEKVT